MQGKIADFSIPDIFQLVSSQRKSGSLAISGNDRVTVFLFSDGRIVDVQPDRREARSLLGTMLRDAGYLTDGELRRYLESQGGGGKKLGEILVEKGKISGELLGRYLALQIKECVFDVLTLRDGEYRFEGFLVRPPPWAGKEIRPDVLMMEGMQFLDEYPIYRQKFPSGAFRVNRKKGEKVDPYAFSEEERILWKALEFSEEPDRVFRKACLTGFEGIKALAALLERGLIDIATAHQTVDPAKRHREEMRFRRHLAWAEAGLWAGAAGIAAVWMREALLSTDVVAVFAGWVHFF
ncbi:MAG: DUF4388 domain-containing protein [Deltaproteobacteria bacterium]|nr:DUF4388 domain-containing protein [Deltaproteobacteria bacterium]